jgi:tryptophanyl-tRNA synthetase
VFGYPVLQAADILLYQPHLVPVGEDQRQHLELARDIARRFNDRCGPTLRVPEADIRKEGARVMSLQDGTAKMSKSDPSELSRLNLLDPPDRLRDKIKRAKTDPILGLRFDPERPECFNLLTIYRLLSGESREAVEAQFAGVGFGKFKPLLADLVIEYLRPIRERYEQIAGETGYLDSILRDGAAKASRVANATLTQVRDRLGLVPPL